MPTEASESVVITASYRRLWALLAVSTSVLRRHAPSGRSELVELLTLAPFRAHQEVHIAARRLAQRQPLRTSCGHEPHKRSRGRLWITPETASDLQFCICSGGRI